MENYETFAFIYDKVMDTSLYEKWLSFSKRHLPKETKSLLELACGTGALAVELAKEGYEVTGLDLSEEMLMMAYNRAVEEEVNIQWCEGDMLDLSEVGTYQAVTCFSDSLCYMKNRQEVQQVFDEVYRVLEDDGVFIFDVHSIYQIDEVFPNYSYHENEEDFAFLWDSFSGGKTHSIVHELTFFVENAEGVFERIDEVHEERTYSLEQYQFMLESAGFNNIEIYADFKDTSPTKESKRWFFVCGK
ncbi:Methyltransferase domain-containing protein [Pilibacter termitis]|uniref:Methyltransferase domain-containing protein n=1 Tax=Pilibacter termitis TaxID=263852 RepID=A0A1T4KUW4_9ENTE|nr:class I SAM-dependent methyltransferase [Pilibacter termitis]SJZ46211.1 Methyltransferase domain-containing protein [Pilibacter termitis]